METPPIRSSPVAEHWWRLLTSQLCDNRFIDRNQNCPYGQTLTRIHVLIRSLRHEIGSNQSRVVQLANENLLPYFFADIPLGNPDTMHSWLRESHVKHPERRTHCMALWIELLDPNGAGRHQYTSDKFIDAIVRVNSAVTVTDMFDDEHIRGDTPLDWDIRANLSCTQANLTVAQITLNSGIDNCFLCMEPWQAPPLAEQTLRKNEPPATDAARPWWCLHRHHYICNDCFTAGTMVQCGLCRGCLYIGCTANNCLDHILDRNPAPFPIETALGALFPTAQRADFHGLAPALYWRLRERSRVTRAQLTVCRSYINGINVTGDESDVMARARTRTLLDCNGELRSDLLTALGLGFLESRQNEFDLLDQAMLYNNE